MKYKILNEQYEYSLIERLLKIRNIASDRDAFFQPSLANCWGDPFLLNDMENAVSRIVLAMKQNHKIMIFGDYDVDGITSSYVLYKFISYFLGYKNVSIMYPNRMEDGYGLKVKHLEEMKQKNVDLIITVDNGITSVEEAFYAKTIGLDLVITDHHQPLNEIPGAIAVVNPKCSPNYSFKGLAGVGVAFKLLNAMLQKTTLSPERKNQIFQYFLPIVAIGTVADIVPLVGENRFIVQRGLEIINHQSDKLPKSLKGFLTYLNIKSPIDTFHIGFLIGPRINAGGRIQSPYDSLNVLLCEDERQIGFLEQIDAINTERKRLQENCFKIAEKMLTLDKKILTAVSEDFHEGVVGIVAGRITEKYFKPSAVFKIDHEKGTASASLRGPEYFNVIEMLSEANELLERFGGHKGAGGLTVKIENIDKLIQLFENYCEERVQDSDLEKCIDVDTEIFPHEWSFENFQHVEKFSPFGEGNREPVFLLKNMEVHRVEKVGKNGGSHMKIYGNFGDKQISVMFWGKADEADTLSSQVSVYGKIRRDTFNGGFYLAGDGILEE